MASIMGTYYNQMTQDMQSKLSNYYLGLHQQYNPNEYAAQQHEEQVHQAREDHKKAKRTAALLQDAYARQQEKNRLQHNERMAKHQVDRTASSHPESADHPVPDQTVQQPKRRAPRRQQVRPSPA